MRTVDHYVLERAGSGRAVEDEDLVAAVLRRAALLPAEDRALIDLVRRNVTRRQIAAVMGTDPGTVCRRIRKLSERLHDPVVIALLHDKCPLPAEHRQIGVEHLLLGKPVNELTRRHQMGRREVRKVLDYVKGMASGVGGGAGVSGVRRVDSAFRVQERGGRRFGTIGGCRCVMRGIARPARRAFRGGIGSHRLLRRRQSAIRSRFVRWSR